MGKPRLTFYCELPASELTTLFEMPGLIADLSALDARLSLGILELSAERAEIVARLNRAGIPVVAWLLLPEENGYWFNADNLAHARARYDDFKAWTADHELSWSGVGLDIEPDIREMAQFARSKWRFIPILFSRLFDGRRVRQAQRGYQNLVRQIQRDGYLVESYHFPFILDERLAHSDLLQRLTRLVDISADREVLMLYSSVFGPQGAGFLWSYAAHCSQNGVPRSDLAVGLGITGGGVDAGLGDKRPLEWPGLARDLRAAWYWCEDIYIFSLEGCLRQGFLPNLKTFQWDQVVLPPVTLIQKAERLRRGLRIALWTGSHFNLVVTGGLLLWWLFSGWRRRNF